MRSLEDRYRRLLAWYPRAHRDRYEEEMLAVLLAGARPDQHRPGVAESLNLMVSGAVARIGRASAGLGDRRWRAAAGVVGVLLPVALALKNLRPIVYMYALELRVPWVFVGVTTETVVLASLWTLTAVLALAGLRRTAAASAWVAVVTHIGLLSLAEPADVPYGVRLVAVGITAAICLTVAEPSDARFLRTRPGRAFGLAMLLALAWFAVFPALGRSVAIGNGMQTVEPWLSTPIGFDRFTYLAFNDLVAASFAAAAAAVAAIGVMRLEPAIRRRFLAMLAPAAALIWMIDQLSSPVVLVAGQWVALVGVPLLAFAIAALLVHRRERTIERLALGRAAQDR